METIGSYEAKTRLASLLERVAKGERITITKHGLPIAMLVPVDTSNKPDAKETIKAIKEFRKGRNLGDLSISEMIREGRRF